jgi:hypothetical protein
MKLCWAHEAVRDGARTWQYYDCRRSAYALWNVALFRTRARWALIENRLFFKAYRTFQRLGLIGPDLLEQLTYAAKQVRASRGYVFEAGEVYDEALVDLILAATDLGEERRGDIKVWLGIESGFVGGRVTDLYC